MTQAYIRYPAKLLADSWSNQFGWGRVIQDGKKALLS